LVATSCHFGSELGLGATGGSDYHGDATSYAEAHAALHVPASVTEALKAAIASAPRTMTRR